MCHRSSLSSVELGLLSYLKYFQEEAEYHENCGKFERDTRSFSSPHRQHHSLVVLNPTLMLLSLSLLLSQYRRPLYRSLTRITMTKRKATAVCSSTSVTSTATKAGWCLREGVQHITSVNDASLATLVERHGLPAFYFKDPPLSPNHHEATQDIKDPKTCFQSLCRIVAGQFVSGKSAQAAWRKIVDVVDNDLTPDTILALAASNIETELQKPVGLTKNKAACIVDLAEHFAEGKLSEESLIQASEEEVRKALLQVKGIGPWSCDMFLLFYLERPDVLPLGDLGVRKGIATWFGWRGSAPKGQLCPKKDAKWIQERLEIYKPYRSLLTYYMWRAADTPKETASESSSSNKTPVPTPPPKATKKAVSTKKRPTASRPKSPPKSPSKRLAFKRLKRVVTP